MFKRGTMGANMAPLLTGNFKWWNKVDALATQYLIYTDSYTTERTDQANSVPVCWSTPDLNDQSLVNLINTIPERVGDLPFTNINQSLYWLQNTNKYFLLKNGYENIVTDGLVLNLDAGWYDSYPGSGTAWTDLSPETNNGTLVNGVGFSTDGQGSLSFDGSDDYVVINSTSDLAPGTGDFTYSAWVNPVSYSVYSGFLIVATTGGLWIGKLGSDFVLRAYNVANYLEYSTLPSTGQWTNVVVTRSGTLVTLYYNAVAVATTNTNYNFIQANAYIGNDGPVTSANFNGKIGSTLFYNGKALTPAEILQNYNAQKTRFGLTGSTVPTDGLVMYLDASNQISYPTTGTSWYDLSGVNNSGTLVNSPTYNSTNGGVIVFDGTDDYVDVGSNSSLTTNTVTMCVFVYPQNTRPEEIISTANQGSGFRFMTRVYAGNTGTLWGFRPTPFDSEYVGTTQLTNNQWYFLVVTYSTSQLKLYLNANLETTVNSPSGIVYGGDIRFGDGIGGAQQHLQGYIGAYLQYNKVLDSTEITQIFNGLKGKYGL